MNSIIDNLKFDDIKPYTKTIIASMNIQIDIKSCYNLLPITPYVVIKKKRGRKKEVVDYKNPNIDIKSGSIITLKHVNEVKGVDLNKKKKSSYIQNVKKYFRNSLTVVMILNDSKIKHINLKLSQNGKFQITGAKHIDHAIRCVQYFWSYIKSYNNVYTFYKPNTPFSVIFDVVMTNIDFNVGFQINRQFLNEYINKHVKDAICIFDPGWGYTGANIKFKVPKLLNHDLIVYTCNNNVWERGSMKLYDYLDNHMSTQQKQKKIYKERYNTFLVFQSGLIIMSGIQELYTKQPFIEFINILKTHKSNIMEKIIKS